jgi:hypothetical protein
MVMSERIEASGSTGLRQSAERSTCNAMAPCHAPRRRGWAVTNACLGGTRLPRSVNRVRDDAGTDEAGPRLSPVAAVFNCNRRGEAAMAGEAAVPRKGWDKPWTALFSLSVS